MPQIEPRLEVTKTYKLFINGAFPRSESGRSLAVNDSKGRVVAHVSHASRKDLRDAVEAAASAQPKWADATAYNRGQVIYRMAEMLEGKRAELTEAITEATKRGSDGAPKGKSAKAAMSRGRKPAVGGGSRGGGGGGGARAELDACIDRLVCFAGWADKFAQVAGGGCQNPVAGPYYNFTTPEPTGVVGIVSPADELPLLSLISLLAPPLCVGNAIVALAEDGAMIPAAIFGEVCATSDVPPGAINILTGKHPELLDHLARHRAVNAISAANLSRADSITLKMGIAENLKRVHIAKIPREGWFDSEVCESPATIESFIDFKTIWHPAAV